MEVSEVMTLPLASTTETDGWVAKAVPSATPPTGWVVTMSLEAVPEVIVSAWVPDVSPVAAAVIVGLPDLVSP